LGVCPLQGKHPFINFCVGENRHDAIAQYPRASRRKPQGMLK
jgi:hypothetical protein